MIKEKIIVLGANGFLGVHFCKKIIKNNFEVVALVRSKNSKNLEKLDKKSITIDYIGDLFKKKKFKKKYTNIKLIVNFAALAHINIKNNEEINHLNNLEKNIINNFTNKNLKIIHISSAKVIESQQTDKDLSVYSKVKINGEHIISNYYKNHIILRPALVFGPGVKANFLSLIKAVNYNIPLPFKFLNNKRSYIYVENLIDAILFIIKKNHFNGKSYYLCDINDLSTSKLTKIIAKFLSKEVRLFYFPYNLLRIIFKLFGKIEIFKKVMEDFVIDNKEFINDTNWKAPYSINYAIKKTCIWYIKKF